jgi:cellulose synthase/poly-beta-1,6-N-acetylglucosamine synthase-like glycosyltransferase
MSAIVQGFAAALLLYLTLMQLGHLLLHFLAWRRLRRVVALRALHDLPAAHTGLELPVTLIVPTIDTSGTIVERVRGVLSMDYPEFEVVVVNDGSSDDTLAVLQAAFQLEPFPEVYWRRLATKPIRAIYRSHLHRNLRVVDKESGGRADALNAAINASRYPLFCALPADALVLHDSLRRAVAPFTEDSTAAASGAALGLANGCAISENRITGVDLPRSSLGLLQVVEYLRTYPFARLGWACLHGGLLMSGSLSVFRKDAAVEAGGFKSETRGAATELMMRLHRLLRTRGESYSVHFVPDAVGWTVAPETFSGIRVQHERRQWGLSESLQANAALLGTRGAPGRITWPWLAAFEVLGPPIELAAYAFMLLMFALGQLSGYALLMFLAAVFALGFLVSASALLLEEFAFRLYPRSDQLPRLIAGALVENLGYRQLVAWWRTVGLAKWAWARFTASAPVRRELPSHGRLRP